MTFLRLLYQEAYQNFTFTCINSAAWYNSHTNDYKMALKFLGENEYEFSHGKITLRVVDDSCQTRKTKSKTVFEIRTKKMERLPIVDFFPIDYGLPNQAFGFSVGPICLK